MRISRQRYLGLIGGALVALLFVAAGAHAQQAAQMQPVKVTVDLREAPRRIFHSTLTFAVKPGPLTLLYPEWIPGEHGPTGPITNLAGLKFSAGGKTIAWRRDDVDMYAFHLDIPAGVNSIDASLDYLPPGEGGQFSDSPASTAKLAVLEWSLVLLYPAGVHSDDTLYEPTVLFPRDWNYAWALTTDRLMKGGIDVGDGVYPSAHASSVSLTTLVDSPILAGEFLKRVQLGTVDGAEHYLNIVADTPGALEFVGDEEAHFKKLVTEAQALFGAHHYRHYDFMLTLSDHVSSFGLEHHESSDDRSAERSFSDADQYGAFADLLPHEFTHSWNGKYRRPAGLATPDFREPMKGDLLWVYEGLTQYLGSTVLTARSGLRDIDAARENIAWVAAYLDHWPGRTWRPLQDTATAAQFLYNASREWSSWRRGVDFYDESVLIWLEADTIIRRQTQGRKSMDDFCHLFHGGQSGPPALKTYTFDDVVNAMNQIAPYDWKTFFRSRLDSTDPRAPLGGIEAAGWRVIYNDQINSYIRALEGSDSTTDVRFSLGLVLKRAEDKTDGQVIDVIPGSPAAKAGIGPDMRLISINGTNWSPTLLHETIAAAKGNSKPIELLVENAGFFSTYQVDYHDGEKYPHLERDSTKSDLLTAILSPKTGGSAQ